MFKTHIYLYIGVIVYKYVPIRYLQHIHLHSMLQPNEMKRNCLAGIPTDNPSERPRQRQRETTRLPESDASLLKCLWSHDKREMNFMTF